MMIGRGLLGGMPARGTAIPTRGTALPVRSMPPPVTGTGSRFPVPQRAPQPVIEPVSTRTGPDMNRGRVLGSFKKGGKVKRTGLYKLHKGELVAPVSNLLRAK